MRQNDMQAIVVGGEGGDMGFKVNADSLDMTRFLPTFSPKLIHLVFNICLIPSNSRFHSCNRPAITGLPGPCILPPPHLIKSFWLALLRERLVGFSRSRGLN